jgi:hypothetical protein
MGFGKSSMEDMIHDEVDKLVKLLESVRFFFVMRAAHSVLSIMRAAHKSTSTYGA